MSDCCTPAERFCAVCFLTTLVLAPGPIILVGLVLRAVTGA